MGLGSGIRDPGSGKNLFRIPDPGFKKAPDPGSGSATLDFISFLNYLSFLLHLPQSLRFDGVGGGGVAPQLYNRNFVGGNYLPPSTPCSHALPLPPPLILRVG
jgi:hypothetical protein